MKKFVLFLVGACLTSNLFASDLTVNVNKNNAIVNYIKKVVEQEVDAFGLPVLVTLSLFTYDSDQNEKVTNLNAVTVYNTSFYEDINQLKLPVFNSIKFDESIPADRLLQLKIAVNRLSDNEALSAFSTVFSVKSHDLQSVKNFTREDIVADKDYVLNLSDNESLLYVTVQ